MCSEEWVRAYVASQDLGYGGEGTLDDRVWGLKSWTRNLV